MLEAVAKRVEQVDEDAWRLIYQTGFLTTTTSLLPTFLGCLSSEYVVTWLTRLSSPPLGEEAVEQLRSGLSAILAAQRHDAAEFSRHVNPDVDPEWLIDGCQEICVALAAHAATIGWQRPEVDVSNVFASLDMVSEPASSVPC